MQHFYSKCVSNCCHISGADLGPDRGGDLLTQDPRITSDVKLLFHLAYYL